MWVDFVLPTVLCLLSFIGGYATGIEQAYVLVNAYAPEALDRLVKGDKHGG